MISIRPGPANRGLFPGPAAPTRDLPLPFISDQITSADGNVPATPAIGFAWVGANLLLSTLAVVAAAAVPRAAIAFEVQARAIPSIQALGSWLPLLASVPADPLPVGTQHTESAPTAPAIGATAQPPNLLLSTLAIAAPTPLPIGTQQTATAPPPTAAGMVWDRSANILFLTPQVQALPVGLQQVASAPASVQTNADPRGANLPLLTSVGQALPQGQQQTANIVQVPPSVKADPAPNLLTTTLQAALAALPPGKQSTDSATAPQRIGSILFARGVDPGPPAQAAALPVGTQRTEGAPIVAPAVQSFTAPVIVPPPVIPLPIGKQQTASAPVVSSAVQSFTAPVIVPPQIVAQALPVGKQSIASAPRAISNPVIDEPQNLLAGPLGLQPIASSQSEFLQQLGPSPVYVWLAPNVTIRLPVAPADPLPIGKQHTESAPIVAPAVQSFTAPVILPPQVQVQALPVGRQQVASAPRAPPAVQSFTAPVIVPPQAQALVRPAARLAPLGQADSTARSNTSTSTRSNTPRGSRNN